LNDHIFIFRDIAMVFGGALIGALLFWRLRQPLILGYVLAGLVLSPLTPGPRIHDVHTFETMAEVGVILLMFSVGIEFSIPDLLRVKWVALLGAPLGISLSIGLGFGVGTMLGWSFYQCIAVGCIISVASTMVLSRLLMDRGEMTSVHGRIMIALTLVEDVAVVMLTVLLQGMGSLNGAGHKEVLWQITKAVLLLIPIFFTAWKIVPRLLARVQRVCNEEISLLLALTICLVVAAITEAVGLSLALGAFVGGLLLGNSDYARALAEKTLPLRDAFVALFFVTIGMFVDPRTGLTNWRLVAVMAGLILVGKFVVWFVIVRSFGYPAHAALRVGIGLTQIGEFSFILAQVSLHAGLITANVYNAALAASLLTILVNASLFKLIKPAPAAPERIPAALTLKSDKVPAII
jgi:monovalent cation:H+ antiporter-2, CPA2 family